MPYEKKVAVPHFTSQFKQVVDLLVYLKRQPDFFQVNNLADALIHPDRPKKRRRLDELVESREAAKEVLDQIVDNNAGANFEEGRSLAGGRPSILTRTAICGSFKVNKYFNC